MFLGIVFLLLFTSTNYCTGVTSPIDDVCVSQNVVYQVGESWNPNVQGFGVMACMVCTCLETATVSCKSVHCPTLSNCPRPQRIPGKCCPVCSLNPHREMAPVSVPYQQNYPFTQERAESPISSSARVISSRDRVFGSRGNMNPVAPSRVHLGCARNFKNWQHGEYFPNPDGSRVAKQLNKCSTCVCMDGEIYCRIKHCPRVSCVSPVIPTSGDCCPYCPEIRSVSRQSVPPKFEAEMTRNRGDLSKFDIGSARVEVTGGQYTGSELGAETSNMQNRLQDVMLPFITDSKPEILQQISSNVEPITKPINLRSCQSGSVTYAHGDVWLPSLPQIRDRSCIECNCDNGEVKCKIPKCAEKLACPNPVTSSNRCCQFCPSDVIATPPIRSRENNSNKIEKKMESENTPPCVDSGLKIFRFVKNEDVINGSLMTYENDDVTNTSSNFVLVIQMTKLSTRIYNWTIKEGEKQRQVLTMRPIVFQRYQETNEAVGNFVFLGNTTKGQLTIFERKEKRWARSCRRNCKRRIHRIMTSLRPIVSDQLCVT